MQEEQFKDQITQNLAAVAAKSYESMVELAHGLDDKAQKTGALAAALLAVGLGFLKDSQTLESLGGFVGVVLLFITILLLMLASGVCLYVMWVRRNPGPLALSSLEKMTSDLLFLPQGSLDESIQRAYIKEQTLVWEHKADRQKSVNQSKAIGLRRAQACVATAVVSIALFLILRLGTILVC